MIRSELEANDIFDKLYFRLRMYVGELNFKQANLIIFSYG